MKKPLLLIAIGLLTATVFAPLSYAQTNTVNNYYESPFHPKNPDYSNGNLRLQLKERADIERASKPATHYDNYTKQYYDCNWQYNTSLASWTCEKSAATPATKTAGTTGRPNGYYDRYTQSNYGCNWKYNQGVGTWVCENEASSKPQPVLVCPLGYTMNAAKTLCIRQATDVSQPPANPVEVMRYVYVYDNGKNPDSGKNPDKLPSTGFSSTWILLMISPLTGYYLVRRRRSRGF